MATSYYLILAEVGTTIGALKQHTAAGAETSYNDATAGTISANWVSSDWPITRAKDAVVDGVQDVIFDLAAAEHPDVSPFLLDSSNTASGSVVPSASSGSVKYIGPIVNVRDSSNNRLCVPAQLQQVQAIALNENSMYGTGHYYWALDGNNVLYHTRTNVIVRRAGLSRPSFSGNIPLPDQYKPFIVAAALIHLLTKEGMYADVWQQASTIYQGFSNSLRAGAIAAPGAASFPNK